MKHILAVFAILFAIVGDVSSNETVDLTEVPAVAYCGPSQQVEKLIKEAGQVTIWSGALFPRITGGPISFYILTSDDTGDWTMVQLVGNVACIIALGDKNMRIFKGPGV